MGLAGRAKKLMGAGKEVASNPVSGSAIGAGAVGLGAMYGSQAFMRSTDAPGSDVATVQNPVTATMGYFSGGLQEDLMEATLPEGQQPDVRDSGTTAMRAVAGTAGVAAAGYQAYAEGPAESLRQKFHNGKAVFDVSKGSKLKRAAKGAGNLLHKGVGVTGYLAAFGAAAVGTAAVVDRAVTRTAQRVLRAGTPGQRLKESNVLSPRRERKRSSPTGSNVASSAGRMQNTMTGSTVLALHKTGGQGAVLR